MSALAPRPLDRVVALAHEPPIRDGDATSSASATLFGANTPSKFWKLQIDPQPADEEWNQAAISASGVLPEAVLAGPWDLDQVLRRILSEAQFGPRHFQLSLARRAYYVLKPVLPRSLTKPLRQVHSHGALLKSALDWPVEQRYVHFLRRMLGEMMMSRGLESVPFTHFWPNGHRFALVLTHDVESGVGQGLVPALADIEERLGFRSSFNFVPERYRLDHGLIATLRKRGFEVGVHDLNHDGKLFASREQFLRRAERINRHLRDLEATGFRAAFMHRNPDWMQALDIEYDLSFFDTDPVEPVPGGTMSIWPFQLGRFVELPYTLIQDYTLTAVLGERTPRLWTSKVAFIADQLGMALVNTHPDYLLSGETKRIYTRFLAEIRGCGGYWNGLPGEVARWWRARAAAVTASSLPGGQVACARLGGSDPSGIELEIAPTSECCLA